MSTINEKNMNEEISRMLKDLPKINTPANFETELSRRIKMIDTKIEKESWLDTILFPKLAPSAALVVTAVIIILVLLNGETELEDPFKILPKLRVDKISMLYQTNTIYKEEPVETSEKQLRAEESAVSHENELAEEDIYRTDSNSELTNSNEHSSNQRISVTPINYPIDQAIIETGGLNYKIVRLDDEERRQIEFLREKINPPIENLRKN